MVWFWILPLDPSFTRNYVPYIAKETGVEKAFNKRIILTRERMERFLNILWLLKKPIFKSTDVNTYLVLGVFNTCKPLLLNAHSNPSDDV